MKKVEVVPPNPNGQEDFQKESQQIANIFAENAIAIHHIGSTSIPGIYAKPVIDLLVIVAIIVDLYPASIQVKTLGLTNTDDVIIWEYAKANHLTIVSKDSDFHQRSLLYGHPPKFIDLRIGNSPTTKIIQIIRDNYETINQFGESEIESILVLT